jgi:hypothetical protein
MRGTTAPGVSLTGEDRRLTFEERVLESLHLSTGGQNRPDMREILKIWSPWALPAHR